MRATPDRRYRGSYNSGADHTVKIMSIIAAGLCLIMAIISAFVTRDNVGDIFKDEYIYHWELPGAFVGFAVAILVAGYIAAAHLSLMIEQTRMLHFIVEAMETRDGHADDYIGAR